MPLALQQDPQKDDQRPSHQRDSSGRRYDGFQARSEGVSIQIIPGLVNIQKAIENGHRNGEFSH